MYQVTKFSFSWILVKYFSTREDILLMCSPFCIFFCHLWFCVKYINRFLLWHEHEIFRK